MDVYVIVMNMPETENGTELRALKRLSDFASLDSVVRTALLGTPQARRLMKSLPKLSGTAAGIFPRTSPAILIARLQRH